jgi:glycosyltransferase involved in cell wall biosynthesis
MKIVYHHRTRGNGAEGVHIMGIVNAFRTLKHHVTLLSLPGSDPETPQDQQKDNVDLSNQTSVKQSAVTRSIHSIMELTKYVPEFVFELIELAYNIIAFIRVGRVLKHSKTDLLFERYSLFMFAGVLQARRKGIPVIIEVNDAAIVERVRPLFFKWIAKKIESWVLKNCNGIVFISTNFKETVEREHGVVAPSVICPNAADIKQFTLAGIDKKQEKSALGLEGKVVCGYVGAFVYWHGIDWFVKEIAPRLKAEPQLALLLVGDGVVYQEILDVVKKYGLERQVIMPGRVPHSKVKNYIAAMDYGILPDSNQYGSPMKLFEMMAMGVALVSPSFEPISEVVTDDENGWLFEPNDKQGAVNKVLELSKASMNIDKVGKQAETYIREQRQWIHNIEKLLSLLD